jgi:hypothetical protein
MFGSGAALDAPAGSRQRALIPGSLILYTIESSDAQAMGTPADSSSMSRSLAPAPLDDFSYRPHFPVRSEAKTMRLPSGDQIGDDCLARHRA